MGKRKSSLVVRTKYNKRVRSSYPDVSIFSVEFYFNSLILLRLIHITYYREIFAELNNRKSRFCCTKQNFLTNGKLLPLEFVT